MGVYPDTTFKKKANSQGKNVYASNRSYVCTLMDAGFIPYGRADEANFVNVANDNHEVFTPDIISSIDDDGKIGDGVDTEEEEERFTSLEFDQNGTSTRTNNTPGTLNRGNVSEARDNHDDQPVARCFKNLLNDENNDTYDHISDMDVFLLVSFETNHTHCNEHSIDDHTLEPDPEPPPPHLQIHVCDVQPWNYVHDALHEVGGFIFRMKRLHHQLLQDNSHLL